MADPATGQARAPLAPPPIPPLPPQTFDTVDLERNQRMNLFLKALALSGNWSHCCKVIGVHRDTPRGWAETYPAFADAVKQAKEDRLDRCVGNIYSIADDREHKDQYRANLAILVKERPKEWGPVFRFTAADAAPMPDAIAAIPPDQLSLLHLLDPAPEPEIERITTAVILEDANDGHAGDGAPGSPPVAPEPARPGG